MPTNRKEHLRYRYGICLNDKCSKCKSKEVQQIPARKELVCEECQKPLRECPPPKSSWDKYKKMIIGVIVALIAALVVFIIVDPLSDKSTDDSSEVEQIDTPKGGETETDSTNTTVQDSDSSKQDPDSINKNPETTGEQPGKKPETDTDKKPQVPPTSSITVPFGTYSGPANGLDGEIRVTRAYTLDLRNPEHEVIELMPGDVITKTKFKNGELVIGYWQRGSKGRSFHR